MKDISLWERIGYGGKSTLDKEEIIDPKLKEKYLIKYPRDFKLGVSWEDITELIAADIGTNLGLKMMDVEIVTRNSRRGSLLKNFIASGIENEEGGVLLNNIEGYEVFLESPLMGQELIKSGFEFMKKLDFWEQIKQDFIEMNYLDILIGNQDRHPYNWMILFESKEALEFSTIYDNGASLGFRFDDNQLKEFLSNESKLHKYIGKSTVKAGLFEKKKVKSKDMLLHMKEHYFEESKSIIQRIEAFDFNCYNAKIDENNILNNIQKEWLKLIISYRRRTILQWYREGEE